MMQGQHECIITPLSAIRKVGPAEVDVVDITFGVELRFAGYTFHDVVKDFDMAFQMKTDFEKKFKILRESE